MVRNVPKQWSDKLNVLYVFTIVHLLPIPVAERSKAWVCSRSHAGIAGSNPAGGVDVCLL